MKHTRNDFFQEIFDKVSNHLLTQNEKSHNGIKCFYKFKNLKCAAGCLIPDKDYDFKMEYHFASELEYFDDAGYSFEEIKLIEDLQIIHDSCFPELWREKLIELVNDYSLAVNF